MTEEQKVLQFPQLCRGCKKVAEINDHGNYFCETCYQDYESGSKRLKRVLYQIQRHAKIGKVQLKGVAITIEGDVHLTMPLDSKIPHSYASEQEAKAGVGVVKNKPRTTEYPSQKALLKAIPPTPPATIKPLVLRPINEPRT